MTIIRINNVLFYAYHGVLEYEKEYGNQFEVDIEMECDTDEEKLNQDKLESTVNYLEVYNLIKELFHKEKFNLIETINSRIGNAILENFSLVSAVEVSIRKPNAPLGIIDSVEIIKEYYR